jgi:hypothetical protein
MHVQLEQALEIASPGLNWLGPYDHFCKLGGIEIVTSQSIGERRRLKPKIDSTFICTRRGGQVASGGQILGILAMEIPIKADGLFNASNGAWASNLVRSAADGPSRRSIYRAAASRL